MRLFVMCAALVGALVMPVLAQSTLDYPVGELQPYHRDSGVRSNPADAAAVVYQHVVRVEGAAWLRVYFGEVQLEAGSSIRITSLLDKEVQELDASGLAMWSNSSAYFNGDAVKIEMIAGAKTRRNQLVIREVARTKRVHPPRGGLCGICGSDKRAPSNEQWTGRLLPAGCTASVWNQDSCLVSAGHCISGGDVIQFNVPDSEPDCDIVYPPPADQFPITGVQYTNGGVGNDWAVMTTGTNNLGQTIFDRYGEFRPIATSGPSVGNPVDVWGYGIDLTCTQSQTQQTDDGSVSDVFSTYFQHTVDITYGNSGSAVIRNGEILGIVTHCPCPGIATRVDHPNFAAAREALCGATSGACCLVDDLCDEITLDECDTIGGTYLGDGTTCTPNPCLPPTGACCLADGSCFVAESDLCNLAGGTYQGDGTSCSPDPCPQPTGACCFLDDLCDEITLEWCNTIGGTYLGDGTTCTPNPCLPPTGACCLADGSCFVTESDLCNLAGGTYQGDGTDCGGADCPSPCPADLDGDGTIGPADLAMLLTCWGTPCGDLNNDGTTDPSDLAVLLANWGPCP